MNPGIARESWLTEGVADHQIVGSFLFYARPPEASASDDRDETPVPWQTNDAGVNHLVKCTYLLNVSGSVGRL